MDRRKTKLVDIGGVSVGGGASVKIQSMTTTKTADVESTVAQILALERAGCDIIRGAVADEAADLGFGPCRITVSCQSVVGGVRQILQSIQQGAVQIK